MKIDLTKNLTLLNNSLESDKRENNVARAKADNIQVHFEEQDKIFKKILEDNNKNLSEIKTKLLQEKKKHEEVQSDIARLRTQLNGVLEENKRLNQEISHAKIDEDLRLKKHEEDEKFDGENAEAKKKWIEELENTKLEYTNSIEKDERLQRLRVEYEDYKEKAREAEKKLNEINYQVLEYETLQNLSVKQKDEEIEIRKKLQDELEKWRDQLDETVKNNELKVQKKLREAESNEIKQAQANLLKEERELADVKQKF